MRIAAVIGWPISHSRSPLIHGHWLRQYGISGVYERRPVEPQALPAFIQSVRRGEFVGCNVTVPHKEAVVGLADETDGLVRAIGAANTLWVANGKVLATNSDAYGFMANLNSAMSGWAKDPGVPMVMGAGGSARAVLHALLAAVPGPIRLCNRTLDRAVELARHFGDRIEVVAWDDRAAALEDVKLLINCTTLGMAANTPLDLPLQSLPDLAIVYDLVYVPLKTPLIAAAQARGLRTVGGLGMLLYQAVIGFEHWFGQRPEVTSDLFKLVAADVEGR